VEHAEYDQTDMWIYSEISEEKGRAQSIAGISQLGDEEWQTEMVWTT